MSSVATRLRHLFVEPRAGMVPAPAARRPAAHPLDRPHDAGRHALRAPSTLPRIAVLVSPERAAGATGAIALALARACRRPCAIAAVVGAPTPDGGVSLAPAASAAAARLRGQGRGATAAGRLVWMADRRWRDVDDAGADATDAGGLDPEDVLATSAALARATRGARVPAALGIAVPRTAAVDGVLAGHDGVVVVREPDATAELDALVLASLAALDRPAVAMPPLGRIHAGLTTAGLRIPSSAARVVAQLVGEGS